MTVLLRHSKDLPGNDQYQFWFTVTGTHCHLETDKKLPRLAQRLEAAFNSCRNHWWELGLMLNQSPSAGLAYASTGAAFGSDFGIMLAWTQLCRELLDRRETVLVICDDPWLFRQLATQAGTLSGKAPVLWMPELINSVRGTLSRLKVSLKMAKAAFGLKSTKEKVSKGDAVMLVYGHPQSDDQGHDAYFGDLMKIVPGLCRLLHTDCPIERALELTKNDRTVSLHAWGNPFFALTLIGVRWTPLKSHLAHRFGWLVRRAVALENSGGGLAMNKWQMHCQRRWLKKAAPFCVIWPWENFNWERDLCRAAKTHGIPSYGYQHTVIGPHQLNYSMKTNPDGAASIPDHIIANGPAYYDELIELGLPKERISIGGAFRFKKPEQEIYNPNGPAFIPLSANRASAEQQMQAARVIAGSGRQVLVKEHPMYPLHFKETENLVRTQTPLPEQSGLSFVLYSTGTSGLEAVLNGLPTIRLLPEDRVAIDVLPKGIEIPTVTLSDLPDAIYDLPNPAPINWNQILTKPDTDFWREITLVKQP